MLEEKTIPWEIKVCEIPESYSEFKEFKEILPHDSKISEVNCKANSSEYEEFAYCFLQDADDGTPVKVLPGDYYIDLGFGKYKIISKKELINFLGNIQFNKYF